MKYSVCDVFSLYTLDFIPFYIWESTFKGSRHSASFVLFYFYAYIYPYIFLCGRGQYRCVSGFANETLELQQTIANCLNSHWGFWHGVIFTEFALRLFFMLAMEYTLLFMSVNISHQILFPGNLHDAALQNLFTAECGTIAVYFITL